MGLVEQLNSIFYPRSIAIIGATDNPKKVSYFCVRSVLEAGFKGKIYPVNPELSEILGLKTYPSLSAIPGEVDLMIISIPAQHTLPVIEEGIARGVKGMVMFTSGFSELGTREGLELQEKIKNMADAAGIKIIGPNSLGVINPRVNLNATFGLEMSLARPGHAAVATQSGGISTYIANILTANGTGISKLVSMGNRCNLSYDEILEYYAQDDDTRVIVLHVEGLDRARQFLEVARRVAKQKPVVAYKVGRSEKLNQPSLSHTGTLAGNYAVYKGAFAQAGIISVNSLSELADVTKALAYQPIPSGNRVAIVSAPAGLGIILADKCYESGLELAQLSPATEQRLRQVISPLNPVENPVDVAWVCRDRQASREVLQAVVEDNGVDMVVVGLIYPTMQIGLTEATGDVFQHCAKPVAVTSLSLPNDGNQTEIEKLEKAGIPVYTLPENTITGLAGLARYQRIREAFGG